MSEEICKSSIRPCLGHCPSMSYIFRQGNHIDQKVPLVRLNLSESWCALRNVAQKWFHDPHCDTKYKHGFIATHIYNRTLSKRQKNVHWPPHPKIWRVICLSTGVQVGSNFFQSAQSVFDSHVSSAFPPLQYSFKEHC